MTDTIDYTKVLETIATCKDVSKLNNYIDNATRKKRLHR